MYEVEQKKEERVMRRKRKGSFWIWRKTRIEKGGGKRGRKGR